MDTVGLAIAIVVFDSPLKGSSLVKDQLATLLHRSLVFFFELGGEVRQGHLTCLQVHLVITGRVPT